MFIYFAIKEDDFYYQRLVGTIFYIDMVAFVVIVFFIVLDALGA